MGDDRELVHSLTAVTYEGLRCSTSSGRTTQCVLLPLPLLDTETCREFVQVCPEASGGLGEVLSHEMGKPTKFPLELSYIPSGDHII